MKYVVCQQEKESISIVTETFAHFPKAFNYWFQFDLEV